MYILKMVECIAYSGTWTSYYGIFSDDSISLVALDKLKVFISKRDGLKIDSWESMASGIGYEYPTGGDGSVEIYLEEVELNKELF